MLRDQTAALHQDTQAPIRRVGGEEERCVETRALPGLITIPILFYPSNETGVTVKQNKKII